MAEGTIEIGGKPYQWTSPSLADLEGFETIVGPIADVSIVNSVRGRCYLAHLCLKEKQPELTLGAVRGFPAETYNELWPMIVQAIPLWTAGSSEKEPSPLKSSRSSSGSPAGSHPEPDASA